MTFKTVHKGHTGNPWRDLDKYCSVSICCPEEACTAAKSKAGLRYLLEDAPELPLRKCNAGECACSYASYRDRRGFLSNRRSNSRLEAKPSEKLWRGNRRAGADRRTLKVDFRSSGAHS